MEACENMQKSEKWAIQDLNKKTQPLANKKPSKNTETETVHNPVHNSAKQPELEQIINAWPTLPEDKKKQILEIITEQK